MGLHNLFNFNVIFPVGICILICTSLPESAPSVDPRYESCKPRNCGSGPNISYPFWILGTGTDHCGYPGFETSCEKNTPILRTSQSRYIIQNISYTNQSFRLVDMDIIDTTCLTSPQNFSFRSPFFKFGPNHASLLFFYNCTNSMSLNHTISPVTCASNATHHSFVALVPGEQDLKVASLNCESKVAAPVELEEGQFNKTIESFDYIGLLRNGFAVEWFGISCGECEKSGGHCGFNDKDSVCFCPDGTRPNHCSNGTTGRIKAAIGIAFSSAAGFGVLIFIVWYFKRKFSSDTCMFFWKKETQKHQNVVAFLRNYGSLAPKRYSYSDVKKMTNSFKDKLGQGGYGCVYKGNLHDGCLVAVKILNESKGNGEEFVNEVASISKTSHVNIVTLLGYCFGGSKRALIYEFMPNGPLEKFNPLRVPKRQLGWETLYQIAIGIARGLEYLHRSCNTRILHFDIKPHNILLDEDFCPKVSNFGLAKLCPKKESIISMPRARGTAGYIAPEVFCRNFGGVSHKSDVYSYGMMVLEMIGGRKNIDIGADHTSEIYFPHWIHKRLERGDELGLHGIMNEDENERAKTMILVGLWCIQTDPSNRPPMGRVVEMCKGTLDPCKSHLGLSCLLLQDPRKVLPFSLSWHLDSKMYFNTVFP